MKPRYRILFRPSILLALECGGLPEQWVVLAVADLSRPSPNPVICNHNKKLIHVGLQTKIKD